MVLRHKKLEKRSGALLEKVTITYVHNTEHAYCVYYIEQSVILGQFNHFALVFPFISLSHMPIVTHMCMHTPVFPQLE